MGRTPRVEGRRGARPGGKRGRTRSREETEKLDLAELAVVFAECPIEVLRADWINQLVDASVWYPDDFTPGHLARTLIPVAERLGKARFTDSVELTLEHTDRRQHMAAPTQAGVDPYAIKTGTPPPPKAGSKTINPVDRAAMLKPGEYMEIPESERKTVSIKARMKLLEKEGKLEGKDFQVYATARKTTVILRLELPKG